MGSFRSKEDDVNRVSTSIFVTNFPDSFTAKELFHACKQYGHVVDSFIPMKRSKEGKRFGFVRFINVFNVDRLVSNLCTIWVDRSKFHANIARFHRPPLNSNKATEKKNVESHRGGYHVPRKDGGDMGKSFVNVVKSNTRSGSVECDSTPAIVLDEECLYSKDLTNSLLGRVKEFASLTNLKTALQNEGLADINVKYMGELFWCDEFNSPKSKDLFRNNVGVGSWFSEMREASIDFNPDGRIVWVEVEGVPLKFWSGNTFKRIAEKWGELLDVDDQEENCYHSKRLCLYTKMHTNIYENFKIIFRGKVFWIRAKEVPGWVPELLEEAEDDENSEDGFMEGVNKTDDAENCGENSDVAEIPETNFDESIGMKEDQSDDPFGVYSLLKKNRKENKGKVVVEDQSWKYPPGFTPNDEENDRSVHGDKSVNCNADENNTGSEYDCVNLGSKGAESQSVRFKKSEAPRTGVSFLGLMEEVVKVGQTMGYNMEGCVNNLSEIIASHGVSMVD
ncbi:RNA-directed DNA polymerase, eukaryota, reverse transcriptase zinc-binding domain protein [Tanacetum coccineum]